MQQQIGVGSCWPYVSKYQNSKVLLIHFQYECIHDDVLILLFDSNGRDAETTWLQSACAQDGLFPQLRTHVASRPRCQSWRNVGARRKR